MRRLCGNQRGALPGFQSASPPLGGVQAVDRVCAWLFELTANTQSVGFAMGVSSNTAAETSHNCGWLVSYDTSWSVGNQRVSQIISKIREYLV